MCTCGISKVGLTPTSTIGRAPQTTGGAQATSALPTAGAPTAASTTQPISATNTSTVATTPTADGVGPQNPVGPQASLNATHGVVLRPGDDIQAAVEANPPGTVFHLTAGTYNVTREIIPKSGDQFLGDAGAILDGGNSTAFAFRGEGASSNSNVTIQNLVIQNFNNPMQHGAIDSNMSPGWIIKNNEIANNAGGGITGDTGSRVIGNFVHHNGQIGLVGHGEDLLVEGNEVSHNNTRNFDPNVEAGGSKWAETNGLVVRNNYVHDNNGPGLWTDINNINTLYENNRVDNNRGAGIFHEISYDAVIRNNVITGNGDSSAGWLWHSGIQIAASRGVQVYGNTLSNNANGISVLQQTRGTGRYGEYRADNISVHDNNVTMQRGASGLVQDVGDRSIFNRSIVFANNIWHLPSADANAFAWDDAHRTQAAFRAAGNS